MGTERSVLVIAAEERFKPLAQPIWQALVDDRHIRLATDVMVDLGIASDLLARRPEIAVVVVAGDHDAIERTVERVRSSRDSVGFEEVSIVGANVGSGIAQLSLRDTVSSEIATIVRAILDSERAEAPTIARIAAPEHGVPPRLPVVLDGGIDKNVLDTLKTALAWADAAANALLALWSGDEGDAPGFHRPSTIVKWLTRLVGIADAPSEAADRRFAQFEHMLDFEVVRHTPLVQVAELLDRDEMSLKLLLVVMAPELDIRFQRIYGSLHDDFGRRHASVALASAIIAAATARATPAKVRATLSGLAKLRQLGVIDGFGAVTAHADDELRIHASVLDWLVSGNSDRLLADPTLAPLTIPSPTDAIALLPTDRIDALVPAEKRGTSQHGDTTNIAAILLTGSERGWIEADAGALAMRRGNSATPESGAVRIAPPRSEASDLASAVRGAIRAARLTGRRLIVDLLDGGERAEALWRALLPQLGYPGEPPYVLTADPAALLAVAGDWAIAVVSLPAVTLEHRAAAIDKALPADVEERDQAIETISSRFRIGVDRMPDVVELARNIAAADKRNAPSAEDAVAGVRGALALALPSVADRITPRPRADDESPLDRVILPAAQASQLRAVVDHVRVGPTVLETWGYGALLDARGIAVLLSGESGTGKTMAATALAAELQADLYVVDLSRVLSKFIGETEERLDRCFAEAEAAGAVLLFDEADALFGKRGAVRDAHDRYANIEVSYLLQRMEKFSGLAILTSNLPDNIDPAFARRLRFAIDFPRPTAMDRVRIWQQVLPAGPHLADDVDFVAIGRRLDLTGGSIRQIALHALMSAAARTDEETAGVVGIDDLRAAIRVELTRLKAFAELAQLDAILPPRAMDEAA